MLQFVWILKIYLLSRFGHEKLRIGLLTRRRPLFGPGRARERKEKDADDEEDDDDEDVSRIERRRRLCFFKFWDTLHTTATSSTQTGSGKGKAMAKHCYY